MKHHYSKISSNCKVLLTILHVFLNTLQKTLITTCPVDIMHHLMKIIESQCCLSWGSLKVIQSNSLAMNRDNVSSGEASTASLDNLFQCLTILVMKNKFLIFDLNLPSFCQKPLCLALSQQTPLNNLPSSSLQPPLRYWSATIRSPQSLLFSTLNSPSSFNLSLQMRSSITWIISVGLL